MFSYNQAQVNHTFWTKSHLQKNFADIFLNFLESVQSKLKNSFVYEYEMTMCGIYSKNSHLWKGCKPVTPGLGGSMYATVFKYGDYAKI